MVSPCRQRALHDVLISLAAAGRIPDQVSAGIGQVEVIIAASWNASQPGIAVDCVGHVLKASHEFRSLQLNQTRNQKPERLGMRGQTGYVAFVENYIQP